jgi:hypothetical protein
MLAAVEGEAVGKDVEHGEQVVGRHFEEGFTCIVLHDGDRELSE